VGSEMCIRDRVKVGIDDMFELVECDECGTKLEVPEELLDY